MASLPKAILDLVTYFERLPGIGPKSATRLAFYILNAPESFSKEFSESLIALKKKIVICEECFGVSEEALCEVCRDSKRDKKVIWVVEKAIDMMALENVGGVAGVYHVLGGLINPLDHVGPDDIKIEELMNRLKEGEVEEVILATNSTMEGEATALYIKKEVKDIGLDVKISRLGSGLPIGADLEFADQATLSRSMESRREI